MFVRSLVLDTKACDAQPENIPATESLRSPDIPIQMVCPFVLKRSGEVNIGLIARKHLETTQGIHSPIPPSLRQLYK